MDVFTEMLGQDDVASHAIGGLRKLKAKKTRPHIEPFLGHPIPRVRREARAALKGIDRAG